MYYHFFLITFLLSGINPTYSKTEYDKAIDEFEEGKETNPKKQDLEMKYVNYLSKLLEQKVIEVNDIKKHADEIEMGFFNNPIQCSKGKCDTTKLIHYKEIENYKKNLSKMSITVLYKYLNKLVEERIALDQNKYIATQDNQYLDNILDFVKIDKGSDYLIFRDFEKIELSYIDNMAINIMDYLELGPREARRIYRFKRLKINEDVEVAANLVSQRFFAEIMGYNPSYENVYEEILSKKITWVDFKKDNKVIKIKNRVAVSNLSLKQLTEFIHSLNHSNHPLVLKINNGRKCKYDIIKQEYFDYLKFHYLKKFKEETVQKLQEIYFSREDKYDLYMNLDITDWGITINFDSWSKKMSFYFENLDEERFNKYYKKTGLFSFILEPEFREFKINQYDNDLELDGGKIYDIFHNKLIFARRDDKVCIDGIVLLHDPKSCSHFFAYTLFDYQYENHVRKNNKFYDLFGQKNSCLLFEDLRKIEAEYGISTVSKTTEINVNSSFYTGIRLTRKCED